MSITEQKDKILEKYGLAQEDQILYGTNIPMPQGVDLSLWGASIRLDQPQSYFFYFDRIGFSLFPFDGETGVTIPWSDVISFKVTHFAILGKITLQTAAGIYRFQTNRFVFGCPWIGRNTRFLEENNYFYNR